LTDYNKSGKYYIDIQNGYNKLLMYMCNNIKNYYIKEENVLNLSDYLDYYIQQNIIDIFCKLNKYEKMMSFLLKPSTPLYPYFKQLIRFPKNYNLKDLYEKIWFNSEKNTFFNQLQLLGERKLLSTLLEELKNIYGIKTFDSDLFETYVDIIHLSGNYVKAVKLYDEYLSNYTKEEIYSSEILIHYYIRMLHHSMFFKPVKTLYYQAEELVSQKNIMLSNKDYAELLFLLGGNLGVLSGEFDNSYIWLKKCESFCMENNMYDNILRVHRTLADILSYKGLLTEAIKLIEQHIDLNTPVKNRYQIYLLAALGETYRQSKNYKTAYQIYDKLEIIVEEKGLSSWVSHIYLCKSLLMIELGLEENKIMKYLSKCILQYSEANHIWGIINSTIVKYLLLKSKNISYDNIELKEKLAMAQKYQYKYEVGILESLINDTSINNFRLFLL